MTRRLLLALVILMSSAICADAQEWIKAYGGTGEEYGYNIFPTTNGGFIIAGTQSPGGPSGGQFFWVAKFDSAGTKLWDNDYGTPGVAETHFGSSQTRDGGLLFGGFTGAQFSGEESAIGYRIDTAGNEKWHFQIDYKSSDHFHFFIERPEGGYYFGGHTDSKTDPNGNMWLVRTDSARNVLWEKEYDNGSSEHAHWGIETPDGGALLLGHTEVNNTEKFWLVKADSNGTKQWDKVYSSANGYHDSPYHLFRTREGNYALIGGSSSASQTGIGRMWLIVVDTTGKILISQHYGDLSSDSFAWSGQQTSDGGYIIAGYTAYKTHGNEDMYIVKTHPDGTVEWEKTIGGAGSDVGYDVMETADGYIATGYTNSPSIAVSSNGDLLVVKIKKETPAPPFAPVLISPPDGSSGVPTSTTLTWHSTPTATKYQLEISTDEAFTNPMNPEISDTVMQATNLTDNTRYWWRVKASNSTGWGPLSETWSFVVGEVASVTGGTIASGVQLFPNVPNPFGESTSIRFSLAAGSHVALTVADLLGRNVADLTDADYSAGEHTIRFDATALPPGTYICRLGVQAKGGTRQERTMPVTVVR